MVVPASGCNQNRCVNRGGSRGRSHSVRSRDLSRRGRCNSTCRLDRVAGPLDPTAFPTFAPFLWASQGYARLSGCRFRGRSFDLRQPSSAAQHRPHGVDLQGDSKAEAALAGREFATKLLGGDLELLHELSKASSLVFEAGVRSSMVATCQRLDLWPPRSTLLEAGIESCEKGSATLELIAWQLYLDDADQRHSETQDDDAQIARTAAYIADFGHAAGVPEPTMPAPLTVRLQDFTALVADWEEKQQSVDGIERSMPGLNAVVLTFDEFATSLLAIVRRTLDSALGLGACKRRRVPSEWQQQVV